MNGRPHQVSTQEDQTKIYNTSSLFLQKYTIQINRLSAFFPAPQNPNLLNLDLVRRTGDVLITPLADHNVLSPVPNYVPAFIVVLTLVLELDFIAGAFGAIDADVKDVGTCKY